MSKMKELYKKVAADSALREKFAGIMKEEVTEEKLTTFAKEAGYDVTIEEMQEFFRGLAESKEGTLSDAELDQVAGGKSLEGIITIVTSVISFGMTCGAVSAGAKMVNDDWRDCKNVFS
jgi:predicted ribosomally synthesized peptide with nif11-like leader